MAISGQRFELNLDADNWKFDVKENEDTSPRDVVKEVKQRDASNIPAAPTLKSTKTGFPEHRNRRPHSTFKQKTQAPNAANLPPTHPGPSDRAILHHVAKKQGIDLDAAKQKADIDAENKSRINDMSLEEIEEARAELMAQFNPNNLQKFLQRANVDDDQEQQQKEWDEHEAGRKKNFSRKNVAFAEVVPEPDTNLDEPVNPASSQPVDDIPASSQPQLRPLTTTSTIHFPKNPRNPSDYTPLDPSSETFLTDLRTHYFPDLPYDPSSLSWMTDPTPADHEASPYNPERTGFAPSALRFSFNGALIPPSESLDIPTSKGLHHHGDAPSSAGYTIPELTILARSALPNQRCVAYQVVGRILFRLGREDFGPRGQEMCEGLWTCIERERVLEIIMAEAGRSGGHMSAKAYATEALWLWRRGGGGDRGVLKENERRAT